VDPTRQSIPNLSPTSLIVDAPTTARSPATFSSSYPFTSRTLLAHFPSLICALSRTLSPPLLPCARDQTSSAAAHLGPPSVLRPTLSPLPVCCLGEFCLAVSYLGHPLGLPFPSLFCPVRTHRSTSCTVEACHRRPETSLPTCRPPGTPEFALVVSNLPMPLIRLLLFLCLCNSSPELIRTAVSPPRRVPRSLVPLRRRGTHGRVCHVALNTPDPLPRPLEPRHGRPPRLRRDFAVGSGGATAPVFGYRLLDLGRPSEIWQSRFNQSRPNLSPPIQIRPFPSPPHPRPVAGPSLSAPRWFADTPSPPVSARCTPASARASAGSNHVC
jgi:hypothetical protein